MTSQKKEKWRRFETLLVGDQGYFTSNIHAFDTLMQQETHQSHHKSPQNSEDRRCE
jgi:hypothetical protein